MSQYIPISTPDKEYYRTNRAIVEILSFLGTKYKETHHGSHIQNRKDYRVGRDYVAKRCGKHFKSTIDNMAFAKKQKTVFDASYSNWRLHRTKANKFLVKLYWILRELNVSRDIWLLFDQVYNDVSGMIYVEKQGGYIISCPYHSEIHHAINDPQYSEFDKKGLDRISRTFSAYDKFYRG